MKMSKNTSQTKCQTVGKLSRLWSDVATNKSRECKERKDGDVAANLQYGGRRPRAKRCGNSSKAEKARE